MIAAISRVLTNLRMTAGLRVSRIRGSRANGIPNDSSTWEPTSVCRWATAQPEHDQRGSHGPYGVVRGGRRRWVGDHQQQSRPSHASTPTRTLQAAIPSAIAGSTHHSAGHAATTASATRTAAACAAHR